MSTPTPIPFETFAHWQRITPETPPFYCAPPEWAAAAHAMVGKDHVHYLWAKRRKNNSWVLMHSTAPITAPADIHHDARNPVLVPSEEEDFDNYTVEYPFPFRNPADQKLYAYYLGKRKHPPKQTGLLVNDGDWSKWKRVQKTPVIAAETPFESQGSSHPSVAIDGDTLHILYTGESDKPPVLCHATAPTRNPATVTKDPANPVFTGSGEAWDSQGVRETEILKGPVYYHIFYGGSDGTTWRIGHVRTRDFRTFEANPHNPIFTPSTDPDAWDSNGLLTSQVFEVNGTYYMLYAGMKGREWQSGLAIASQSRSAP